MTASQTGKRGHGGGGPGAKKQRTEPLRDGVRGFLLSAGSPFRSKDAAREAINLIKLQVFGDRKTQCKASGSDGTADFEKELKSEIASENRDDKLFKIMTDLTKGMSFIQVCSDAEATSERRVFPSSIVHSIAQRQNLRKCRHLRRLIPIEISCSPHTVNFEAAARKLVAAYFPEAAVHQSSQKEDGDDRPAAEDRIEAAFQVPKGSTWSVMFERRAGMKTIDKKHGIEYIAGLVGGNYKVDLTQAQYTVVVELNNRFCGLAVCPDYLKLAYYNLFSLTNKDEDREKADTVPCKDAVTTIPDAETKVPLPTDDSGDNDCVGNKSSSAAAASQPSDDTTGDEPDSESNKPTEPVPINNEASA